MLSNLVQLEQVISGKVCRLICEANADTTIIKEALFQFQNFIGTVESAAKAQQTASPVAPVVSQETQAPVAESTPVEPVAS